MHSFSTNQPLRFGHPPMVATTEGFHCIMDSICLTDIQTDKIRIICPLIHSFYQNTDPRLSENNYFLNVIFPFQLHTYVYIVPTTSGGGRSPSHTSSGFGSDHTPASGQLTFSPSDRDSGKPFCIFGVGTAVDAQLFIAV